MEKSLQYQDVGVNDNKDLLQFVEQLLHQKSLMPSSALPVYGLSMI